MQSAKDAKVFDSIHKINHSLTFTFKMTLRIYPSIGIKLIIQIFKITKGWNYLTGIDHAIEYRKCNPFGIYYFIILKNEVVNINIMLEHPYIQKIMFTSFLPR